MFTCALCWVCWVQVFETLKAQEATKQQEQKAKEAEFKAAAEKAAIVSSAGAGYSVMWCCMPLVQIYAAVANCGL